MSPYEGLERASSGHNIPLKNKDSSRGLAQIGTLLLLANAMRRFKIAMNGGKDNADRLGGFWYVRLSRRPGGYGLVIPGRMSINPFLQWPTLNWGAVASPRGSDPEQAEVDQLSSFGADA